MKKCLLLIASGLTSTWCIAAPVDVAGGIAGAPTDVTARLIANEDLNFTGGSYIVKLPKSGSGIFAVKDIDTRIANFGSTGYSTASNPSIKYTGAISGNGVLEIQSGFDSAKPAYGQPFSGGALVFASPTAVQTWSVQRTPGSTNASPALIIGQNATVVFYWPGETDRPTAAGAPPGNVFAGNTAVSRNIVNDGFLMSTSSNAWGSITGNGVSSFAFFGGDRGSIGTGAADQSNYSAESFHVANGFKIEAGTVFQDRPDGQLTKLVTRGLATFSPKGSMTLTSENYKPADSRKLVPVNMFNWGLNIQLWWSGIHQFTGLFLPTTASKSFLETALPEDAVKGVYSYNGAGMAFGRVININNSSTLMMGDGRAITTGPDGVTTNVWLQGNPFNTLLSTSNFVGSAPAAASAQAIAYAYSGSYRVNHNFNAAVNSAAGVINGIRSNIWTNLIILDPTVYNDKASKPNNPIITTPVFFGGLTRIDNNAILQLGDGTTGNRTQRTLTFADGSTVTYPYSDSGGNGMLMTKGNAELLANAATKGAGAQFQLLNNGKLIVNNTPGALDASASGSMAGAAVDVAAWMSANQLDGIVGGGSLEQRGKLPLTLGAPSGNPNTYTGGTLIARNATLLVNSATALGAAVAGTAGSGKVSNQGTLQAVGAQRTINVPGDYSQHF